MSTHLKRKFWNWLGWTVGAASIPLVVNFLVHLERGSLSVFNIFDSGTLLFLSIVICASLLCRTIGMFGQLGNRRAWTLLSFFALTGFLASGCIGILESHRAISTLRMDSGLATICHELPADSFQIMCIVLAFLVLAVGVFSYVSSLQVEQRINKGEKGQINA